MDAPDGYVDALLREREGYVRAGRADRVAQVDQQLAMFGVAVADGAPETTSRQPDVERAVLPKAKRRR